MPAIIDQIGRSNELGSSGLSWRLDSNCPTELLTWRGGIRERPRKGIAEASEQVSPLLSSLPKPRRTLVVKIAYQH